MVDDKQRKAAADAQFKKQERATEGAKAMSEYKAEGDAERAKTARLRAQRLAKEAADLPALRRHKFEPVPYLLGRWAHNLPGGQCFAPGHTQRACIRGILFRFSRADCRRRFRRLVVHEAHRARPITRAPPRGAGQRRHTIARASAFGACWQLPHRHQSTSHCRHELRGAGRKLYPAGSGSQLLRASSSASYSCRAAASSVINSHSNLDVSKKP